MASTHLDSAGRLKEDQISHVPLSGNDTDEIETENGAGLHVLPALLLSVLALLVGVVLGIETQVPWQFAAAALVLCTGAIVLLADDSEDAERRPGKSKVASELWTPKRLASSRPIAPLRDRRYRRSNVPREPEELSVTVLP